MKKILLSVLTLALLFSACACNYTSSISVPDGMKKNDVILAAEAVVNLLNHGEYDTVYDMLRDDVVASLSEATVEDTVKTHLSDAGEFKKYSKTAAFGQTDPSSGEKYAVATIEAKYSEKKVTFNIGFDTQMQLIGLSVNSK